MIPDGLLLVGVGGVVVLWSLAQRRVRFTASTKTAPGMHNNDDAG
jgi:hypothetical protein